MIISMNTGAGMNVYQHLTHKLPDCVGRYAIHCHTIHVASCSTWPVLCVAYLHIICIYIYIFTCLQCFSAMQRRNKHCETMKTSMSLKGKQPSHQRPAMDQITGFNRNHMKPPICLSSVNDFEWFWSMSSMSWTSPSPTKCSMPPGLYIFGMTMRCVDG